MLDLLPLASRRTSSSSGIPGSALVLDFFLGTAYEFPLFRGGNLPPGAVPLYPGGGIPVPAMPAAPPPPLW